MRTLAIVALLCLAGCGDETPLPTDVVHVPSRAARPTVRPAEPVPDTMAYPYADTPLSDALTVVAFALRDVGTSYVPEMTVRPSGATAVHVLAAHVIIPGIDAPGFCRTHRTVPPGADFRLFRIAYGDYDLAFTGQAADDAVATVVVYFVDDGGLPGKVVATSTITPGAALDPLTSDPYPWGWDCGSRPLGG